jgi:adenosylmethionine-8-amino-7-oxononanoate aminotransferase
MSHVFHRHLHHLPKAAVSGDGVYIVDAAGNRYLDACGGAAVSCLGHNHDRVIDAIMSQVSVLPYAHTSFFTTSRLEQLCDELIAIAPGMDKVMLLSGGSEAIEAALKLSRQYFVEKGEPERDVFIARRQSYHGNTLGALSVGGNEWRRNMFAPLLSQGHQIAPCYE